MSPEWEAIRNELMWAAFLQAIPMALIVGLLTWIVVYLILKDRNTNNA